MSSIKEFTATLANGARLTVPGRGSFLFMKNTTAPLLTRMIEVETGGRSGREVSVTMANSDKIRSAPGAEFDSIALLNSSGASATFTLIYGTGDYDRPVPDTVNVSVSVPASDALSTVADITVTTAAVISAASTTRQKCIITALASNDQTLRIGDSNVTATRGTPLAPGETIAIESGAAIYAVEQVSGTNAVAITEELVT